MTARSGLIARRRFLLSCGGAIAALSGCAGRGEEPTYRTGEVEQTGGSPRTAAQMAAAEALATTETNDAADPLESLELRSHEFVLEDGYKGSTVQGVVANTGESRIGFAEVRVRVYGTDDAQLGQYMATTGDLDGGTTWKFQAILLNSASDIAAYDIAVVGIPD